MVIDSIRGYLGYTSLAFCPPRIPAGTLFLTSAFLRVVATRVATMDAEASSIAVRTRTTLPRADMQYVLDKMK